MLKKHLLSLSLLTSMAFCGLPSYAASPAPVAINSEPSIEYLFLPTSTHEDKQAKELIQASDAVSIIKELSRSTLKFTPAVSIMFGAEDGPLYDPEKHRIDIPYSFFNQATERFQSNRYSELGISAQQAALDTMLHTLLHELGHAYIAANDIPVLGKEEDAVDNFATVILLNYVENGAEIAISAADLFAFEDQEIEAFDSLDFIDEHSLDIQRYYYTLCLIYGSDPKQHSQLLADIDKEFKTERQDICLEEFDRVTHSWMSYLDVEKSLYSLKP